MGKHLTTAFFGLANGQNFIDGIQKAIHSLTAGDGIYTGDNLFTYHRNLSFLIDKPYVAAFTAQIGSEVDKALLWRFSTVLWGVRNSLRLAGDFVECACYKATTARIISDTVKFAKFTDRRFYLYDLFEHDAATIEHHTMPDHGSQSCAQVQYRFKDYPNVTSPRDESPWYCRRSHLRRLRSCIST
jgi:hypothetical protein